MKVLSFFIRLMLFIVFLLWFLLLIAKYELSKLRRDDRDRSKGRRG